MIDFYLNLLTLKRIPFVPLGNATHVFSVIEISFRDFCIGHNFSFPTCHCCYWFRLGALDALWASHFSGSRGKSYSSSNSRDAPIPDLPFYPVAPPPSLARSSLSDSGRDGDPLVLPFLLALRLPPGQWRRGCTGRPKKVRRSRAPAGARQPTSCARVRVNGVLPGAVVPIAAVVQCIIIRCVVVVTAVDRRGGTGGGHAVGDVHD